MKLLLVMLLAMILSELDEKFSPARSRSWSIMAVVAVAAVPYPHPEHNYQ